MINFLRAPRTILSGLATLALFLTLTSTEAAWGASGQHNALRLLGKSVGGPAKILSLKKQLRPQENSPKAGPDYNRQGQSSTNGGQGAGLFFDLQREVEVEAETWHGSTGLQIN